MASIPDRFLFGAGLGLAALIAIAIASKNTGAIARGALGVVGGAVQGAGDVVTSGLNAAARAATGDPYVTWGTAAWEFFNPEQVARERELLGGPLDRPGGSGSSHGATGSW